MDNQMYTVLAWLPGTANFVAQASDGQIGYVHGDDKAEFQPMFPEFLEASVHKYGYIKVPATNIPLSSFSQLATRLSEQVPS
jgi:uncharacterized protein YbjT (DUF2867 family)